jgi:hypothetical protein
MSNKKSGSALPFQLFCLSGAPPLPKPKLSFEPPFHDAGATRTVTGQQLMTGGLTVSLDIPNSSELIFIESK